MATKEITKREPTYPGAELEPQLLRVRREESREKIVSRIAILWDRRQFLFRSIAITFVASSIIVLLLPVSYTSTTRLMPPDQNGQGVASMLAAVAKATGDSLLGGVSGMKTTGDLFVGVLQSRRVQDDVVNKFDLRKLYGVKRLDDARKILHSNTEITADRKSGIITVAVTDGSAERAAAMGREYIEALNSTVISLNTSSAHKERTFLEERIAQVKQDLEDAEKEFSQFASKNAALDVKEQGRAMIGAGAELEGRMIAAQTQLEGLRQIYTENNVRVRSLQAQVDEYRRQLEKIGGRPSTTAGKSSPVRGDRSGEDQGLYPTIQELPLLGVTWSDLYRRTKVEETVFETLTKQYEVAKVEEARETPSVKVLDPAEVPERRSSPHRTILVLAITTFVFIFLVAWVLLSARWQEIDPEDPAKALSIQIFETARSSIIRFVDRVSPKRSKAED
jgi:capsule polysaccharide export protein KpsE/RkpR